MRFRGRVLTTCNLDIKRKKTRGGGDNTRWFHICWQASSPVDRSRGGGPSFLPFSWCHAFSTINPTEQNSQKSQWRLDFKVKNPADGYAPSTSIYIIFRILSSASSSSHSCADPWFPSTAVVTVLLQEPKRRNNPTKSPLKAAKQQVESGDFVASLVSNVTSSRHWEEVRIDSLPICVRPYCQRQWNRPRSFLEMQWQMPCLGCKSNLLLWGRRPAPTHYRVVNTSRLKR